MVDSLADPDVETEKKEPGRIEFSFPMLTVRTRLFSGIFDRIGSLRASRLISWVALVIVPIVAVIGLYLLSSSLFTLLWTPVAREVTRELNPASYLLLPGINPILPFLYGWLAIVCAVVIHEGAHGIIARNRGLNVKSSGLLFFLIIPIGAFVDVELIKLFDGAMNCDASDQVYAWFLLQFSDFAIVKLSGASGVGVD